jgi:hypothetical protein
MGFAGDGRLVNKPQEGLKREETAVKIPGCTTAKACGGMGRSSGLD